MELRKILKSVKSKSKFRIGIAKEYLPRRLESEVHQMIDDVRKTFEAMDIEVVELSLPHTKIRCSCLLHYSAS